MNTIDYIIEFSNGEKILLSGISSVKQNYGFLEFYYPNRICTQFDHAGQARVNERLYKAYRVENIHNYGPDDGQEADAPPALPNVRQVQAPRKSQNRA